MSSIRLRLLKWLIAPILLINLAGGVLAYKLAALPAPALAQRAAAALQAPAPLQTRQPQPPEAVQERNAQWHDAVLRALLLLGGAFALASIGLIWFSVSNGLRPLQRLRTELGGRAADELAPLDAERLPTELAPVVSAFNGLLGKVGEGARARQQFLADVAHQLRTPLAGLKTQLEWLAERHGAEPDTAQSVQMMQAATERMIRQTNQLLALARAEPQHFERTRLEAISLDALVQDALQGFVQQAVRANIDIGFHLAPVAIRGDRYLLRDLIDNLVDNALRYTPAGGAVTVRCGQDSADTAPAAHASGWLVVEDNGPGIAQSQRAQVFKRYVRFDAGSHGSGLGLAIVRDIAAVHGATVTLGDGPTGCGLAVRVQFPLN